MPMNQRLMKQLQFIVEIDKLKSVCRQSYITDRSRHENDAEHTWHLTAMAILLLEHADNRQLDMIRVLKMLIVHDLVEIDAGDTFAYDERGHEDKYEREKAAARRIFGLLPDDQRQELIALWEEFEARETPEAQYAAAMDRLQPLLQNFHTEGKSWREHGVTSDKVLARNRHIGDISRELWEYVQALVAKSVDRGYLKP